MVYKTPVKSGAHDEMVKGSLDPNGTYLLPEHLETILMFQAKKEFATDDCTDAGGTPPWMEVVEQCRSNCREQRRSSCRGHREHRGFSVDFSVTSVTSVAKKNRMVFFSCDLLVSKCHSYQRAIVSNISGNYSLTPMPLS